MLQVSKAACILTTQPLMRILRSREAAASVNVKTWPTIIDTGAALFRKLWKLFAISELINASF